MIEDLNGNSSLFQQVTDQLPGRLDSTFTSFTLPVTRPGDGDLLRLLTART